MNEQNRYTDVEQLTQWRENWDQFKSFRNAIQERLLSVGVHNDTVLFFTDTIVGKAISYTEEDPEHGKEYMKFVIQVLYNEPRTDSTLD